MSAFFISALVPAVLAGTFKTGGTDRAKLNAATTRFNDMPFPHSNAASAGSIASGANAFSYSKQFWI